MDSTGLRLALQIQGECRDADRDFALVHGPDNVRRLFAISDLLEVLPFRDAADIDLAGVDGGGISPLA
jgi:anti-anti-sigma factor